MLLVAACQQDGGVIIYVHPTDPSVDHVRLYLGRGSPTTANLTLPVAGANATARKTVDNATYWVRDPQNELDFLPATAMSPAKFVFVRGDTTSIPAVIAVGYAGQRVVEFTTRFDLALPATKFVVYDLALEHPIHALGDQDPQVATWSEAASVPITTASCAGVVDTRAGSRYDAAFIVSENDQDCDGLISQTADCNDNAWFGSSPAQLAETSCLVDTGPTCVLGGPFCTDGMPKDPANCAPTNYCTPSPLCTACGADLAQCGLDVTTVKPTAGVPAIECTVHTNAGGNLCTEALILPPLPTGGLRCTRFQLANRATSWSQELVVDNAHFATEIAQGSPCDLQIKPSGHATAATPQLGGLAAIDLANDRGLALPIKFRIMPGGCTNQPVQCTGAADASVTDELASCATSWTAPTPAGLVGFDAPSLTEDQLEIFLHGAGDQLYSARRPSRTSPWPAPQPVVLDLGLAMGVTRRLNTPEISADGKVLYFSASLPAVPNTAKVYKAERQDASQPWMVATPVALVAHNDALSPSPYDGQQSLIYTSNANSATPDDYDLYDAAVNGTSELVLTEVNSPSVDAGPSISADGRTLVFHSNRPPSMLGDLWIARRASDGEFSPPVRISALSSAGNDTDPWLSSDGRTIFFASNRSGGVQIYEAHQ